MRTLQRFAVLALVAGWCASAFAFNPYWYRKYTQTRRSYSRQTTVAAVRGVDEPGEVDPNARDYEAVKAMDARKTEPGTVDRFLKDGDLNQRPASANSAVQPEVLKTAAEAIGMAPVSREMQKAVRPISLEEEQQIGREVAANIAAQFGVVNDPALTEYVNEVGLGVARFCPRQEVPYRFAVLDSPILNAFAAPGGYVFVTKGLLMSLKDEAELACVLGHEIAHVARKHVVNEIQKSRIVQASIPDYVSASAKNAEWMNQVSNLAVESLYKGLSRKDEAEADRLGVEWAASAGYDAHAFAQVLSMLQDKAKQPEGMKELKFLFSTHPKPQDRLKNIEQELKGLPAGGQRDKERFEKSVKA